MNHPYKRLIDELKEIQHKLERILSRLPSESKNPESPRTPQEYSIKAIQEDNNPPEETQNSEAIGRATVYLPETIRVDAQTHENQRSIWHDRMFWVQVAAVFAACVYPQ